MPSVVVDTDALRAAAKALQTKAGEMRAAVNAVESAIAPARSMKAPKVAQGVQQWDTLKSDLMKIFPEAENTSTVITATAANIDIAAGNS
jgi:hypothetical protein